MIQNFRSYDLAVRFHRSCKTVQGPIYLKNQLQRASSSIVLNLAEGSAKPTLKDKRRYYFLALGSLRECQAALDIASRYDPELLIQADLLGAHLYLLCKNVRSRGS